MNTEILKALAEAGEAPLNDERAAELARVYAPIFEDTRRLRELDLGSSVPGVLFEAD